MSSKRHTLARQNAIICNDLVNNCKLLKYPSQHKKLGKGPLNWVLIFELQGHGGRPAGTKGIICWIIEVGALCRVIKVKNEYWPWHSSWCWCWYYNSVHDDSDDSDDGCYESEQSSSSNTFIQFALNKYKHHIKNWKNENWARRYFTV